MRVATDFEGGVGERGEGGGSKQHIKYTLMIGYASLGENCLSMSVGEKERRILVDSDYERRKLKIKKESGKAAAATLEIHSGISSCLFSVFHWISFFSLLFHDRRIESQRERESRRGENDIPIA